MNAHYKQFVPCFLENLFLAKSSKLESTGYNALPFNQSINQSVRLIVAELLLGKVRNEKENENKQKDGFVAETNAALVV